MVDVEVAEVDAKQSGAESTTKKSSTHAGLLLVLVAIGTVVPYLPALRYGFVYDDDAQVLDTVAARSWQSPSVYFLSSVWGHHSSAAPIQYAYYRPAFFLWLRVNAALFGLNPMPWHLSAICVHVLASILVFFFLKRLFSNPLAAAIGALVFSVHPAHIESVVWVSGVTDPLAAVGVLGSLLLWLRNLDAPRFRLWVGSLTCYTFALLSKEIAIVLPVLIFGHVLLVPALAAGVLPIRQRLWTALRQTAPFLIITIGYLAVRTFALSQGRPSWISTSEMLLTVPALVVFYLRHLFWPVGLSLFYDFVPVHHASDARFWFSVLILVAAAGCAAWIYRLRQDGVLLEAAVWAFVPIIPALDIAFSQRDDFIHDRYLYLSTIGIGIFAAWLTKIALGERPTQIRRLVSVSSAALLIAALAGLTAVQSSPWQNNLVLYTHAANLAKSNSVAQTALAREYALRGRLQEAKVILEPLVRGRPDFWFATYNLGYVDYWLKDFDPSAQFLDRAIALNQGESEAYLYRGLIYFRKNRIDDAIVRLRQAIALNTHGESYHFTLAMVMMQRDSETSKSEFREELKYHPNSAVARMELEKLEAATPATRSPALAYPYKLN